jgi:hypothetical protein
MDPKYASLKISLDDQKVLRITAMMCEDPMNPDYIRVSFGYQSPLDQDWKQKGKDAAQLAMVRNRFVSAPKSHLSRNRLLILAMGMSIVYPQGIQWMNAVINEIGDKWMDITPRPPIMGRIRAFISTPKSPKHTAAAFLLPPVSKSPHVGK